MKITIRATTPEDMHLSAYRYSQLAATNMCPTLGALSYRNTTYGETNQLDMNAGEDAALGAGRACHEGFAAVRLLHAGKQIRFAGEPGERALQIIDNEGERLFGSARYDQMLKAYKDAESYGTRRAEMAFMLEALHSSGYEPDVGDRKRSMPSLESALMAYIDNWDWDRPIWCDTDKGLLGIELQFDVVIVVDGKSLARYQGTIDGLHWDKYTADTLVIHENKTGSRIGDYWADSFKMSHQVTGYMLGAAVLAGRPIFDGIAFGLQLPVLPTKPVWVEPIRREEHHFHQWLQWLVHSVWAYEEAAKDPLNAPKFTHSCNRYFRRCEFLPFCHGDLGEKQQILDGNIEFTVN